MPEVSSPPASVAGACCAVVVTFNRRDLLRECLTALLAQTRPVARILVMDNAGTDGTPGMLAAEFPAARFPAVETVRLPVNVGGAGGFRAGMERALADGRTGWIWLLDDDTIARPDTLEQLLAARARFAPGREPALLASKVLWTDGSLHAMNRCAVKYTDNDQAVAAAEHGALCIRTATFVSLLMPRSVVERHGLPWADYFIWGDDTEFTARVLRQELGVLVPTSVVLHKTVRNHSALDSPPAKFYYHLRNELWMLTRSPAWTGAEKVRRFIALLRFTFTHLRTQGLAAPTLRALAIGTWHGLAKGPTR